MTTNEFNLLTNQEKNVVLFEAQKIAERTDGFQKFCLFKVDDFFIETKTSILNLFKRTITTYSNMAEIPLVYAANLQRWFLR